MYIYICIFLDSDGDPSGLSSNSRSRTHSRSRNNSRIRSRSKSRSKSRHLSRGRASQSPSSRSTPRQKSSITLSPRNNQPSPARGPSLAAVWGQADEGGDRIHSQEVSNIDSVRPEVRSRLGLPTGSSPVGYSANRDPSPQPKSIKATGTASSTASTKSSLKSPVKSSDKSTIPSTDKSRRKSQLSADSTKPPAFPAKNPDHRKSDIKSVETLNRRPSLAVLPSIERNKKQSDTSIPTPDIIPSHTNILPNSIKNVIATVNTEESNYILDDKNKDDTLDENNAPLSEHKVDKTLITEDEIVSEKGNSPLPCSPSRSADTGHVSKGSVVDLNSVSLSLKPNTTTPPVTTTILKHHPATDTVDGVEETGKKKRREKRVRIAVTGDNDDVIEKVINAVVDDNIGIEAVVKSTQESEDSSVIVEKPSREARRAARKLKRETRRRKKERRNNEKESEEAKLATNDQKLATKKETTKDKLAKAKQTDRDRMDVDLATSEEEDEIEDIFMKAMKKYGITIN